MTTPNAPLSSELRDQLLQMALAARRNAYAPYSKYQVGAALLASDGRIFNGCNVENASYGATICAERTALVKAVSEGARTFSACVVATADGQGSPCGICRQVLFEFAPALLIFTVDQHGQLIRSYTLRDLLLDGFGPANLE